MHIYKKLIAATALATVSMVAQTASAQTAGVTLGSFSLFNGDGPWTLGYNFTATQNLTVTGLGAFDNGSNGFADAHQVGLWSSTGALLASTSVGSADTLLNGFRYAGIGPVSLIAGQSYTVGASNFGVNDAYALDATISTASGIQFNNARYASGATLANPINVGSGNSYFGGNILLAAVPEPATWALMILGMGAVGFTMRRGRKSKVATTVRFA